MLHTNYSLYVYFFLLISSRSFLSLSLSLSLNVYMCFFNVFFFTCNYIIFVLFVLFSFGLMQRYRCLYVAVQQWSTKFNIFNIKKNTKTSFFCLFNLQFSLVCTQAIFLSLFWFVFLEWLYVSSLFFQFLKFSFYLFFFLHYRQYTQRVCGNLFCCYYIKNKSTKKKKS